MNKDIIEDLVKISELNAKDEYDIKRITYKSLNLVSCEAEIEDEEVRFRYSVGCLEDINCIAVENESEKFRFLLNVSELFNLLDMYSFDLKSDNLYYDYNYNPKILKRDVKIDDTIVSEEEFVLQYKSLIGSLFIKKYSYEDVYNGGIRLLKSNKITKDFIELKTIDEIKEKLIFHLEENERYRKEKIISVKKHNYNIKKHSIRIMAIVIVMLTVYSIYEGVFLSPFNENIIKGTYSYMEQDYEGVIKYLEKAKNIKFMNFDKVQKYELAYSYITSENLSESQRKNVLLNLTSKSDENILDYWITIGEIKYDEAIDLAKKLQDDELILYALLNKYKYIQDDATLTGEEKDKEKQSIKSEIDKLTQQLNKEENESTEVLSQEENSPLNQSENNGLDLVPSNN